MALYERKKGTMMIDDDDDDDDDVNCRFVIKSLEGHTLTTYLSNCLKVLKNNTSLFRNDIILQRMFVKMVLIWICNLDL